MKLNKQGRDELRKFVEKELQNKKVEERIKLDKNILECLLFEKVIYRKNPQCFLKLPIWSGSFLQKLDLSAISFDDVSWTLMAGGEKSAISSKIFDPECWEYFLHNFNFGSNNRVEYQNTNAKIDFNKSFESKVGLGVLIFYCNFSGTSLKEVDTSHFQYIQGCSFSNTGLVISESLKKEKSSIFHYSDLSGLDLGNIIIKAIDIASNGGPLIGMGCNLSNTRISILLQSEDFKDKVHQNNFRTILASGDLNGCYINGKRVLSSEEKTARKEQVLKQYEDYKSQIFDSISASIQKQLSL